MLTSLFSEVDCSLSKLAYVKASRVLLQPSAARASRLSWKCATARFNRLFRVLMNCTQDPVMAHDNVCQRNRDDKRYNVTQTITCIFLPLRFLMSA